ncbi:SRPBCC family protein [Streptomyces sp. TS71-3]|uniref:SRPBCC family protein n=1 Tax=Streptomyces sp. TS71-3 TaxID=2733862 RepID=UPI001BB379D8|nr:SRPBCC family protein [Streptomyces sp. TS71-3]
MVDVRNGAVTERAGAAGGSGITQAPHPDGVTGARVTVELEVAAGAHRFWDVISDVSRIGEFSPECVGASWLDEAAPGPRQGASFRATNRFADGHTVEVPCVVTEAERSAVFAWAVLDRSGDPAAPGSVWRYELRPGSAPGTTLVRHTFEHGPGDTGARRSPETFQERLGQLHDHMSRTLTAMAAAAV